MTTLQRNSLGRVPMSVEAIEAIYGMTVALPCHSMRKVCESHERLRMELESVKIMADDSEATGVSVHTRVMQVPDGWAWMVWMKRGGKPQDGLQCNGVAETPQAAANCIQLGLNNLIEVGYWKDAA